MKKIYFLLLIICSLYGHILTGQTSAIMDLESTDQGILIPRMTTAQRTAIPNPAKSLLVFDTTTNGFWFFNGTDWHAIDDNRFDGNVSIFDGSLTIYKPWNATGIVQLGGPTATPGITFRSNEPETYRSDIKMYKTGLVFATHANTTIPTVRMSILNNGNVGIGTTEPIHKLNVAGDVFVDNGWIRVNKQKGLFFQDYGGGFYMKDDTWIRTFNNKSFYHNTGIMRTDGALQVGPNGDRFIVNDAGNVGIGTSTPTKKLHVKNGDVLLENSVFSVTTPGSATGQVAITSPGGAPGIIFRSNNPETYRADISRRLDGLHFGVGTTTTRPSTKLTIKNDGRVVIGSTTTPGDYKLYVEKGILTEHLRAALKSSSRWADDAFGKKPNLKELEAFIKQHSHLIGVPSAEELVETGIDMVEMDATLLRQIEWLWEEAIESEREKDELEDKVEELTNRLEILEQLIKK